MKGAIFGSILVALSSSLKVLSHQDRFTIQSSQVLDNQAIRNVKISLDQNGILVKGCNTFTAPFQSDGLSFTIAPNSWRSTKMYCFDSYDEQIQKAFESVRKIQSNRWGLDLSDENGKVVFALKNA